MVPKRVPINVVFGKPISIEKNENPTAEEINKYHALYIEALQDIFTDYRDIVGYSKDEKLEII